MKSIKKLIFAVAALLSLAAFSSCTKETKTYEELLIGDWNITRWSYVQDGEENTYEEDLLEKAGKHSIKYSAGTLVISLTDQVITYDMSIPNLGNVVEYDQPVYGTFTQKGQSQACAGSIKFSSRSSLEIVIAESDNNGSVFTCEKKWL